MYRSPDRADDGRDPESEADELVGDNTAEVEENLVDAVATYRQKNADYGNAWLLASKTLALWMDELEAGEISLESDPERLASLNLYQRRLEKLIRAFNGEFVVRGFAIDEVPADEHGDDITYAAMHESVAVGPEEFD